MSPVDYKTVV